MRTDPVARPEYVAAFEIIAQRIAKSLDSVSGEVLPIRMYVAGGAALHFFTGARMSRDIDAAFSHRIVLPDDLEVSYPDADGTAQILFFDRQYNDSFALMHEEAYDDSVPFSLKGVDPQILDVRLLSALDLAVSKISRFSHQDREDILTLAKHGLIKTAALRRRAEEAAAAYVGNQNSLQTSIKLACALVEDVENRTESHERHSAGNTAIPTVKL